MNYSDHPKSVSEIRADRTGYGGDWSPRDVLIDILRQIDSGKIDPDTLIVCYRELVGKDTRTRYGVSSPDVSTSLGVIEMVKHFIILDGIC